MAARSAKVPAVQVPAKEQPHFANGKVQKAAAVQVERRQPKAKAPAVRSR